MDVTSDSKRLPAEEARRRGAVIDKAMLEGARRAVARHHKLGEDVVTWRDGKVVVVPSVELLAEFDAIAARESATAPRS